MDRYLNYVKFAKTLREKCVRGENDENCSIKNKHFNGF